MATFSGPTYVERADNELWFVNHRKGVTILKSQAGVWSQTVAPVDSEVQAAARAYRGGYTYEIDSTEVAELTAAGYGEYIT